LLGLTNVVGTNVVWRNVVQLNALQTNVVQPNVVQPNVETFISIKLELVNLGTHSNMGVTKMYFCDSNIL